jgi:ATPase involved in DNA replication initiation
MFLEERIAKLERDVALLQSINAAQFTDIDCVCLEILKAVALESRIEVGQILGKNRCAQFAEARQISAWLIRRTTRMSTTRVAVVFGWKCHNNVSHSVKAVENRRQTKREFRDRTDALLARFNSNGKCA